MLVCFKLVCRAMGVLLGAWLLLVSFAADLRSGRAKCADIGGLKTLLKRGYAVPNPDIESVIATLCSQKVVKLDKSGKITVLQAN